MNNVPDGGWVEVWTKCTLCWGKKTAEDNTTCIGCNGEGKKRVDVSINALIARFKKVIDDEWGSAMR